MRVGKTDVKEKCASVCVCCENGSLKRFNFDAKSAAKFGSKHPLTSAHASPLSIARLSIIFFLPPLLNLLLFFLFYCCSFNLMINLMVQVAGTSIRPCEEEIEHRGRNF